MLSKNACTLGVSNMKNIKKTRSVYVWSVKLCILLNTSFDNFKVVNCKL